MTAEPDTTARRDLGAELDVEPLLLEVTLRLLGDRLIRDGQEVRQRLEHHDLAPEPAPDAAQFETDHAGSDDAEPLRHGGELQRIP